MYRALSVPAYATGGMVWGISSLYLGGTLFAVAAETLPFTTGIGEWVVSTWYGLTGTGFFLMFWPLTYLSHRVRARAMGVTFDT